MKSFSNWTIEEVEDEFELTRQMNSQKLKAWLKGVDEISDAHREKLEFLRARSEEEGYSWNELELIIYFISPMLDLINFHSVSSRSMNSQDTKYKTFFTRTISAPYGNDKLTGVVDCVIAQGTHSPRQPFFFLQEYKKEVTVHSPMLVEPVETNVPLRQAQGTKRLQKEYDSSTDPLAQILVAMVAAQLLNKNEHPLYGAYIIGRYWHFVLLDSKEYAVHPGLNGATEDCFEIYQALRNTKRIIEELL